MNSGQHCSKIIYLNKSHYSSISKIFKLHDKNVREVAASYRYLLVEFDVNKSI